MISSTVNMEVTKFVTSLKRRQIVGAYETAKQTLVLLRVAVSSSRFTTVEAVIDMVRSIGRTLMEAAPLELSIGNSVRRVLHVIREEANLPEGGETLQLGENKQLQQQQQPEAATSALAGPGPGPGPIATAGGRTLSQGTLLGSHSSMYNLLADSPRLATASKPNSDLKGAVIEGITHMIAEFEDLRNIISAQALEHIHSDEIIMTLGTSRTVTDFFKAAARKRKFHVIVAETAPWYEGHSVAVDLARAGIDTTMITDAAVFAMMARVNKVIIGTHAVLANGGLIARSGSHIIASAAKYHATPVVVVTGLFKLTPLYAFDQDTFNILAGPGRSLAFEDAELTDNVDVCTPYFDYIPPELVNLFVTNSAGHPPSYIYRLLSEQYHAEDHEL